MEWINIPTFIYEIVEFYNISKDIINKENINLLIKYILENKHVLQKELGSYEENIQKYKQSYIDNYNIKKEKIIHDEKALRKDVLGISFLMKNSDNFHESIIPNLKIINYQNNLSNMCKDLKKNLTKYNNILNNLTQNKSKLNHIHICILFLELLDKKLLEVQSISEPSFVFFKNGIIIIICKKGIIAIYMPFKDIPDESNYRQQILRTLVEKYQLALGKKVLQLIYLFNILRIGNFNEYDDKLEVIEVELLKSFSKSNILNNLNWS